ncbi:MAG: class I SAM-dependent methyltransferase [Dokdonella sp.]
MSELDRLRRVWHSLGRDDPLWAVLSQADKRGGRWQADEFFATGRLEIDTQLGALAAQGWPRQRELALDFGCGVGRLSRALAAHFDQVVGIDVSASMIAAARELNTDIGNIEFRENASPRIEGVADASVDFVFSHITLQHIPTTLAAGYVEEFFRVLAPGGVAVFHFVDEADASLRGRLFGAASNRWLNPLRRLLWRRREVFEMHALPERELLARLGRHADLRLLLALDDAAAGPGWRGRRWFVVNDGEPPQVVVADGHRLYVKASDAHVGAPLLAGSAYAPHVTDVLRERLREGDVVLDVGANIGVVSLLAATLVGARGRVIAVEPVPANRALLARTLQANRIAQIEIIAAAASDRVGAIELRTHPTTSNSARPAAAGERLRDSRSSVLRVPTVVLDDALTSLGRLDLVKLDIAGMEPLALRGLERTLTRWRPLLLSEFHPWAIERATATAPIDYLRRLLQLYPAIVVLHPDGSRTRCVEPDEVMQLWRRANAAAQLDDRLHLDLLLATDL